MGLNSNELRLGNLIKTRTKDDVLIVDLDLLKSVRRQGVFYNPIPLSVEWLKKANYKQLKRIEKTYSLGNFEDNSSIYFTGVRFIHIITGTHLEYLHELQNLHFCLQKQELKF